MSKEFTANDVKEAGSVDKGLHIIIDNDVYKMDGFVEEHPGGAKILKRVGGKDASKQFWKVSRDLYTLDGYLRICCADRAIVPCTMCSTWAYRAAGSIDPTSP
jgi:hypothetical protein